MRVDGPRKIQRQPKSQDDSSDDEVEDPPSDNKQRNLSQVKEFILASGAFMALCENLRNFVKPDFVSKFRELLRATKEARGLPHCTEQESWIRVCMSEVQSIDPTTIEI